ncbi:MAG TPA: AraC family transcriptional regulator, partial [Caldimonas sp.]|nr:AraC family transcriptional regulator [Caldimonas sp.]
MSATTNPTSSASPARSRPVIGIGRVMLWSGGSLWIGRQTGRADEHAHHAIQIALAMRGSFRLEDDRAGWREHRGAIVVPHRRHRFDGCGSDVATIFVEPETSLGRSLLARLASDGVTAIEPTSVERLVAPLRESFNRGDEGATLVAEARRAVSLLAGATPAADRIDPRIERAIAWMRERLAAPIALADAAAVAHLSPSRFRHLFVAQTGVPFRAYLLWARVDAAMGAGMNGESWTAAAQSAGFADSAHFSRTCRRMFGIAPAMLVRG